MRDFLIYMRFAFLLSAFWFAVMLFFVQSADSTRLAWDITEISGITICAAAATAGFNFRRKI